MSELQFDEAKHEYTIGSTRLAGVTEICKFAYPDEFAGIPERSKEYYFERGRQNHRLWEMVELGTADGFDFDPEVEKYRAGHARFLRDTGFRALPGGIELRVKDADLGVAGTLDRLGTVRDRVWLVDLKTTKAIDKVVALQTAIYALLLPGYKFAEIERYGVGIKNNGTYAMTRRFPDSDENDARYWVKKYKEAHHDA